MTLASVYHVNDFSLAFEIYVNNNTQNWPSGKLEYYIITRNELVLLAYSFYNLLETSAHAFDNCTPQIYIPWVQSCVVNLFYAKLYTVVKFTIGHVVAQRGRLNYITNAHTHVHILD